LHIHDGKFRKMGRIGPPITLTGTATSVRKIRGAIVARYQFRFEQEAEVIYQGEHTALFSQVATSDSPPVPETT
jgi:hypothetical protein